jgi:hypothetical protein
VTEVWSILDSGTDPFQKEATVPDKTVALSDNSQAKLDALLTQLRLNGVSEADVEMVKRTHERAAFDADATAARLVREHKARNGGKTSTPPADPEVDAVVKRLRASGAMRPATVDLAEAPPVEDPGGPPFDDFGKPRMMPDGVTSILEFRALLGAKGHSTTLPIDVKSKEGLERHRADVERLQRAADARTKEHSSPGSLDVDKEVRRIREAHRAATGR